MWFLAKTATYKSVVFPCIETQNWTRRVWHTQYINLYLSSKCLVHLYHTSTLTKLHQALKGEGRGERGREGEREGKREGEREGERERVRQNLRVDCYINTRLVSNGPASQNCIVILWYCCCVLTCISVYTVATHVPGHWNLWQGLTAFRAPSLSSYESPESESTQMCTPHSHTTNHLQMFIHTVHFIINE